MADVWLAGDVKSGEAFASDGRTPRTEYAVQVGHYASMLSELRLGAGDRAFVVGRSGEPAWYDLRATRGRNLEDWSERVGGLVARARAIRDGAAATRGALSSHCSTCHWKTLCRRELDAVGDLTLIAGLGRATRDVVETVAPDVAGLAALADDAPALSKGLPGVGADQLRRYRARARLLTTPDAAPYARRPLDVRRHARELHFDLEADPLDDGLVYLHGFLVREARTDGVVERYVSFFADGPEGEMEAFASAWAFIAADPSAHLFYYSKFERTSYRALQARHPDVCSAAEVEALFDRSRSTDLLFDVVMPHTEWPTNSLSIKPIAKWLGFAWRDRDASGAASIAWYREFAAIGDEALRQRILDYNEDDCRATDRLLEALVRLPVGASTWPIVAADDPIS